LPPQDSLWLLRAGQRCTCAQRPNGRLLHARTRHQLLGFPLGWVPGCGSTATVARSCYTASHMTQPCTPFVKKVETVHHRQCQRAANSSSGSCLFAALSLRAAALFSSSVSNCNDGDVAPRPHAGQAVCAQRRRGALVACLVFRDRRRGLVSRGKRGGCWVWRAQPAVASSSRRGATTPAGHARTQSKQPAGRACCWVVRAAGGSAPDVAAASSRSDELSLSAGAARPCSAGWAPGMRGGRRCPRYVAAAMVYLHR
jgi:hypothetical protein